MGWWIEVMVVNPTARFFFLVTSGLGSIIITKLAVYIYISLVSQVGQLRSTQWGLKNDP